MRVHLVASVLAVSGATALSAGQSAAVMLKYADDQSTAMNTEVGREDTGISLSFVPAGDYLLSVTGAADVEYEEVANEPGMMPPTHTVMHTVHSYVFG